MILSKNYIISSKLIGLLFALSLIFFKVEDSYSSIIFVIVMLTIGIPHGSVDHIIAFINPKSRRFNSKLSFFTVYLSLIVLNIIIWVFSPYLGLFTFLLVSCYHFGEFTGCKSTSSSSWNNPCNRWPYSRWKPGTKFHEARYRSEPFVLQGEFFSSGGWNSSHRGTFLISKT